MNDFVMTSVEVFGIKILEPTTSLTDFITGIVCYVIFYKLHKLKVAEPAFKYLKYYFLFLGTATLLGSIFAHAFLYLVTYSWKAIGWSFAAVAMFLIETGALLNYQKAQGSKSLNFLKYLFALQLLVYFILILNPATRSFIVLNVNTTVGMLLFVLPLFVMTYLKTKSKGNKMVLQFFAVSLIPAITFNTKFTLHDYFNYHDISHVIMAFCMILLYFAVKQLGNEYQELETA